MHWLQCSLLLTALCATNWQNSVASEELKNNTDSLEVSNDNDQDLKFTSDDSDEFEPLFTIKITRDSITNFTEDALGPQNSTDEMKEANITTVNSEVQFNLKSEQKRKVTNVTFNDIKPLLFFPILPILFPPSEKENQSSENKFISPQNEKLKDDGNQNDVKPFIFFDFALIRRIPLKNDTLNAEQHNNISDSKIINVKKLEINKVDDSKKNLGKNRRRRYTSNKLRTPQFFDDSPLFPDSELDEFLPKPDLFFLDLPFHHRKPLKKLSRRKRDRETPDLKSDLKFFFDTFDKVFMQTKRELEQTDPILNLLRGDQPSFEADKNNNIFGQISNNQEKPRMKWRIQRNIKRLKNDNRDVSGEDHNGPMIIVDKVVKVGEFHVPDEGLDKDNLKMKIREDDSKKKLIDGMISFEKDGTRSKNTLDLKQLEKRKKRNHMVKIDAQNESKLQSKEIKILPRTAVPSLSAVSNTTMETKKREIEIDPKLNKTNKNVKVGNLMKLIGSLKFKIKSDVTNEDPSMEKLKQKRYSNYESSKKVSYEDLKRNISELLNQFLNLSENSDDIKLVKGTEHKGNDGEGVFDWTEKETLLNSNTLGQNSRDRRQMKGTDFVDEYADLSKKERQIADLNYLFLTVTLPTVIVFALVLLVCFFSLQVKGKICPKLFRPRDIFVVEDEKFIEFKKPTSQTSSKLQAL